VPRAACWGLPASAVRKGRSPPTRVTRHRPRLVRAEYITQWLGSKGRYEVVAGGGDVGKGVANPPVPDGSSSAAATAEGEFRQALDLVGGGIHNAEVHLRDGPSELAEGTSLGQGIIASFHASDTAGDWGSESGLCLFVTCGRKRVSRKETGRVQPFGSSSRVWVAKTTTTATSVVPRTQPYRLRGGFLMKGILV